MYKDNSAVGLALLSNRTRNGYACELVHGSHRGTKRPRGGPYSRARCLTVRRLLAEVTLLVSHGTIFILPLFMQALGFLLHDGRRLRLGCALCVVP